MAGKEGDGKKERRGSTRNIEEYLGKKRVREVMEGAGEEKDEEWAFRKGKKVQRSPIKGEGERGGEDKREG